MKTSIVLCTAALALVAAPAIAQVEGMSMSERNGVVKTTEILKSGKNIEKVTCRSFNALDESFKPQAVDYATRFTAKGKEKDPMIDVTGVERITPVVVTSCKARPDETLVQRIKAAFHRKR